MNRKVISPSNCIQQGGQRKIERQRSAAKAESAIFEWDKDNSASNFAKHGIDFVAAQKIWTDPFLLEMPTRTTDEPRWLAIGELNGRFWSTMLTWRDDVVRLISARQNLMGL